MWELGHKEGWVLENWYVQTVVLEKLFLVPWTARRSNQSILKEINPEYSLEGLMLKLKLQYFGHLMQSADSLGKTLILGKIEGRKSRGRQRMRWLDGITNSKTWVWASSGNGDGQGSLACCSPWGHKSQTWLSEWTITGLRAIHRLHRWSLRGFRQGWVRGPLGEYSLC